MSRLAACVTVLLLASGACLRAQQSITLSVLPNSLQAAQVSNLNAQLGGASGATVDWQASPAVGTFGSASTSEGSDGSSANTYTAPASIVTAQSITITAIIAGTNTSASQIIQLVPAAGLSITPATVSLTNGETQQFTANLAGVSWSISPQTGSISSAGLYTAPALISGAETVTVTAALGVQKATATVTLNAATDVGTGAPTGLLQQQFVSAFYQSGFNNLVSLPPLTAVKAFGSSGYIQTFQGINNTGTYALITGDNATAVFQVYPNMYTYYSSIGVGTAGYPTVNTAGCPLFSATNTCIYQSFDNNYILFIYANPVGGAQDFSISGTFYTTWNTLGGMGGPGLPRSEPATITASTGTTASAQSFTAGAIYEITSGLNNGRYLAVTEPIYDLYIADGGPAGSLGLPTAGAVTASTGVTSQTFEGGAVEYTAGSGPIVEPSVASLVLTGAPTSGSLTLNVGESVTLTVSAYSSGGAPLPGALVSWTTSNSAVAAVEATGQTAVVQAVGAGSATVTAVSGTVVAPKLNIIVIASCCQVGEGAPATVQRAFQNAIARNQLSIQLPTASPAVETGNGYTQLLKSSNPNAPVVYLLAEANNLSTAYVVTGAILTAYDNLGGPAGPLGYPISDATAGGRQLFQNSVALAGAPVRQVSGAILSKWASLGYETGAAGNPVSDASPFVTFAADSGAMQAFANGDIFSATAGPRSGQAYYVSGLILSSYSAIGGPSGDFGMPVSDEFVTGGIHQQNFEGGDITYSPGDAAAQNHPSPVSPTVAVAPGSVYAGEVAHLAVYGFAANATIRVSISGQPDFVTTTANGAYGWDMFVPLSSQSGTISIQAADVNNSAAAASAALTVKGFDDNRLPIAKVMGDNQTGLPGATLPLPLEVALTDASGEPIAGATVVFQASTGAQLTVFSTVTDSSGQAQTYVRLPPAQGVTLVTANAPSISTAPVTFDLLSVSSSLANFPNLREAGTTPLGSGSATIAQKGALLTAVSSVLLYYQNLGALGAPNGQASPSALNQFLDGYCAADIKGNQICDGFLSNSNSGEQIVNLWRATAFTGGVDVSTESANPVSIANLLAQGSPVVISLGLSLNGSPAGGHFVVAIGIAPDGSILIQDPSPLFARTNLNDYLNGFSAGSGVWTASLRGAFRFVLRTPSPGEFVAGALSQSPAVMQNFTLDLRSAAGACGLTLEMWDTVDSSGNPPPAGPLVSRFEACDGSQPVYQASVGAPQPYSAFLIDLAPGGTDFNLSGNTPATYKILRPQNTLTLAPQDVSIASIVNAADFTADIAPGSMLEIDGAGLAGAAGATVIQLDGEALGVISATPFAARTVLPPAAAPGAHILMLESPFGSVQQTINLAASAPAIFLIGNPSAGAVENQNGSVNGPANPSPRGQTLMIYATGLGPVTPEGQFSVTTAPVTVMLNGAALPAAFAGLSSAFPGVYQINVAIPASIPPGLMLPLALMQSGQTGNSTPVALQ